MAMTLDERIEYRRYQITALSALLAADLAERDRLSRPPQGVPVYVGAPAPVGSSPEVRAAWDRAEEKAGEAIGVALSSGGAGDVVTVEFTDAGVEWALRMMGDADG